MGTKAAPSPRADIEAAVQIEVGIPWAGPAAPQSTSQANSCPSSAFQDEKERGEKNMKQLLHSGQWAAVPGQVR